MKLKSKRKRKSMRKKSMMNKSVRNKSVRNKSVRNKTSVHFKPIFDGVVDPMKNIDKCSSCFLSCFSCNCLACRRKKIENKRRKISDGKKKRKEKNEKEALMKMLANKNLLINLRTKNTSHSLALF